MCCVTGTPLVEQLQHTVDQQRAQLKNKDTTIAAKDSRIRELEEQAVLSIDVSVVCVWIGDAHVHVFMYCLSHIIRTTTLM